MQYAQTRSLFERILAVFTALALVVSMTVIPGGAPSRALAAGVDQPDKQVVESLAAQVFSKDKLIKLDGNLKKRFAKGGADQALTNGTWYAALALSTLGQGSSIDSAALLKNLAVDKTGEYFSAGTYAKYIMALAAAGVDCRHVKLDGKTCDLIAEMEALIGDPTQVDAYSAVCILPIYSYGLAKPGIKGLENALIQDIRNACDKNHLVGGWGYYDSQTTAQALLALLPYQDKNSQVASDIAAFKKALEKQRCADGGFAYSQGETEGNLDATATIVVALCALNPTKCQSDKTVQVALTFIMGKSDNGNLKTFKKAASSEPMAAATVFGAGAALQKGANVMAVKNHLKATALTKLTAGKKSLTLQWKKGAQGISGYEVQLSTSKSFKNAKAIKVPSAKTVKKTVKNLKAKQTYYVKIRTYQKVGDLTYCSEWSAVKKKTTK